MDIKHSRRFVAYERLGQTPNIVVDGAGNAATAITLAHWPKSGTLRTLKADTSTEIVFNYLAAPEFHVAAAAVSNNHFDEDGLAGNCSSHGHQQCDPVQPHPDAAGPTV